MGAGVHRMRHPRHRPWVGPELAAGQAAGQAGKEARAQPSRPLPAGGPPAAGQSMQSLKSLLSMLLLSNPGEEVLGSLQGRSALLLVHDNTAPKQLMTAAEMLQAVAQIREDAESRLLEIQAQIQDLEAEAQQLEELVNG